MNLADLFALQPQQPSQIPPGAAGPMPSSALAELFQSLPPEMVAPLLVAGGNPGQLPPIYEIWSRSQGKKVGETTTREGATRAVDRRDTAHGANDYYWKKVGE